MKNKTWQKPTLINIVSCFTIYLCFAFSEWEIDPSVWSDVHRGVASILIGISSFFDLIAYLQLLAEEDGDRK